jgi:hypothetical protein
MKIDTISIDRYGIDEDRNDYTTVLIDWIDDEFGGYC